MLYLRYCHDDTGYTINQQLDDWRDQVQLSDRPPARVRAEDPGWVYNVLNDPIPKESRTGKQLRTNPRITVDVYASSPPPWHRSRK